MQTHHEQDSEKNPASSKPGQDHPGEQEQGSAGQAAAKDPQDLPDGSGSTRPAGSDQGKEDGGESFDAG